ncbi:MAG: hypothetical protein PF483_01140 [Halothiobacillus sp.]|nr:hypothetical protein [Halothiobacillus sp.]
MPLPPRALSGTGFKLPVDVIAWHDPAFEATWGLLVPADSEDLLPIATVVEL